MDPDDDWEIDENFLDEFIPRDEKLDSENSSSKQGEFNTEIITENSSISLRSSDEENFNNFQLTKSNENSRLTKILEICQKKNSINSSSTIIEKSTTNEKIFPSQNPRALNFHDISLNQSLENHSNREIIEIIQPKNRVNFLPEEEKNQEEEKEEEEGENHENLIEKPKINTRENLIKSILNRTRGKIDEEEEKREKNLNRENLVNSILKRGAKRIEIERNESNLENCRKIEKRNVSFSNESSCEKVEKYKQLKLNFPQICRRTTGNNNNSKFQNESNVKKNLNWSSHNNSRTKLNNSKKIGRKVINRRFPGPAGLLPENMDFSNFPMAYLNSFDESETVVERLNESRITNFCSQNTKNRFTSGAWQMMIDDLPVDFFQSLDIATIKRQAKKGHYKAKGTNFFAALVHQMDSNTIVNPLIILKDSSDEIEASVHRDIFFQYPNAIDVGAVLLLNNVTIIYSKFYNMALIHLMDVVAIYNEKERIVTTELMGKILAEQEEEEEEEGGNRETEDESREVCNEERTIVEENSRVQKEKEGRVTDFLEIDENDANEKLSNNNSSLHETIINPTQILHDEEDNEFLSQLNLEEFSASRDQRIIASSTLIGNEIHQENEENSPKRNKNKNKKNDNKNTSSSSSNISNDNNNRRMELISEKSSTLHDRLKQFRHRDEISTQVDDDRNDENCENQNAEQSNGNVKMINFADSLLNFDDEINDEISISIRDENIETIVEKKSEENKPGTSKVQSRLKQFCHRDELTQPEVIIDNMKNKKLETTNFSDLPNSDDEFMDIDVVEKENEKLEEVRNFYNDDKDDEFLSQMNFDDI